MKDSQTQNRSAGRQRHKVEAGRTSARPDYILMFILMALLSVGLIMVFSASPTFGMKLGDSLYYLKRHLINLIIGAAALFMGLRVDYHVLMKWAPFAMCAAVMLLLIIFIPGIGRSVGGAVRWVDLSLLSFQPSEIAKIVVVIYLASAFASWSGENMPKLLFIALAPIFVIAYLVLKQPDLGTTLVISAITLIMLYLAGLPGRYLSVMVGAGICAFAALSVTSPYRLKRMIAFLNPWKDPLNIGFHTVQSLLAIGSGGLLGLGLGGSKQKFFYLPQHYTDFIFSILCEEMGFFGAAGVIILFVMFIIRGMRIARLARDEFGRLLAGGIVSWIAVQALLNLFVVTGMFPITGIPLPFISFGGTVLVVTLYAVGVLLNISTTLLPAAGSSAAIEGSAK